jgi:trans-aconitate methyltransferase
MTSDTTNKYAWNAADYAGHSEVQQQWALELIEKLGLRGDEHLLDIGCGDGKVTAALAQHLPKGRVVGVDSSADMIALAEKSHGTMAPNLSFLLQDASRLAFVRKFDVIFSNAALHWVVDHRPVLKGMYQALKPGGRVLVQMGGKGNAALVVRAMETVMKQDQWRDYFADFTFPYGFYSPEEYTPWLKEAGMAVQSIKLIPKDMVHTNKKRFAGWMRTTWLPYLQRVPSDLHDDFLHQVLNAYLGKNFPEDKPVTTTMQRLEYLARRPQ